MFRKILLQYPAIGQFIRFGLIGGLNTGVDLLVLNTLMFSTGVFSGTLYILFKSISFIFAATFSYFMNKRWAFKDNSNEKAVQKFSQFFAVSLVGMAINVSVASMVVIYLQPVIAAQIPLLAFSPKIWGSVGALFGTAVGLVWNFVGYKFIVFKK